MSDSLTLFPVNRNDSDLYSVTSFTHSRSTHIENAQRDVILRPMMYAFPATFPDPKETSGTEKDTPVFSLCWHSIPLCIFLMRYITLPSAELRVGFDLQALHLLLPWCTSWLACIQQLQQAAACCGVYPCWHLVHYFTLPLSRCIRRVREFWKFHFLLKIDLCFGQCKLSDVLFGYCCCVSSAFKFRSILSSALLWYYVIHWVEGGINQKICLYSMCH